MKEINEKIVKLEYLVSDDYCERIKKQLESKERELDIQDRNKPKEVDKPSVAIGTDEQTRDMRKKINELSLHIMQTNKNLSILKINRASIAKIRGKIENFKRSYELLKKDSSTAFENICISFDSTIKLEINIDSLESLDEECKKNVSSLETSLDKQNPESLCIKKKNLEIELGALQSRLDESEKAYQNYLDEIAQWEKRREEIIGNADKLDSLKISRKSSKNQSLLNLRN